MQPSKKLLLTIAALLLILLITALSVLRKDMQVLLAEAGLINKYKTLQVGNFEALDFPANWNVRIRPGREYKVELPADDYSELESGVEKSNDTLYFRYAGASDSSRSIDVRITSPSLRSIKAAPGTRIYLQNFRTDSLWVSLGDSGSFISKNNHIVDLNLITSGKTSLKIIDSMDN
jgi:hypothetical protein